MTNLDNIILKFTTSMTNIDNIILKFTTSMTNFQQHYIKVCYINDKLSTTLY